MNIYFAHSSFRLGKVYLLASINVVATITFAQTPVSPAIKGTKTDNSYANTTEVSKTKAASDAQVLSEIEGDYGIGDVVRIVITTPKPVINPLGGSTNRTPSGIKMTPPSIQTTPSIGNRPSLEQTTTPPQYSLDNAQPNGSLSTPVTATPTTNRTPQGTTTTPQYNKPNGQVTPIGNRPVPRQNTKQPVFEYYNSKGERITPPNPDGTFPNGKMTPIANRPAPKQTTTPPQYNTSIRQPIGQPIGQPTAGTTPNDPIAQTSTDIVSLKSPFSNTTTTASTSDKLDLTNATQKEDGGTTTNESIRTPRERVERQERAVSPSSGRVASGGRHSKASKSSGFSFKNIFAGMGGMGLKETKRRDMKSRKKYGCYKFN
ncbi:MAG: hypothetical protein U5L45_10910 [Saprospiraceae bacterium]|nr:hypothetical protein [Saprospiraceae bacterium]